MSKKKSGDWELLAGFGSLIFIILVMGLTGIFQIHSLNEALDNLTKKYYPMQNAALKMKINNSLYTTGIRGYVFWKNSRYIEAAKAVRNLDDIERAKKDFDGQLNNYLSYVRTEAIYSQKAPSEIEGYSREVEKIAELVDELRLIGSKIVKAVDDKEDVSYINNLLMNFESQVAKIDGFIDVSMQEFNFDIIKNELEATNQRTARAILWLGWALLFGIIIGCRTAWYVYLNRRNEKKRRERLVHRMITLEEEERKNLSLQVHDQMGQDLSALSIYLDLADREILESQAAAKKQIKAMKDILSGLMKRMHNISEMLRPPSLDEVGLVNTIGGLIVQYEQLTGINFKYRKLETDVSLSGECSLALYRITQEALTNIAKHAQAKKVEISMEAIDGSFLLTVEDDGIGFDYDNFSKRPRRRKEDMAKLGIIGLEERVELLGGSMGIDTAPGKGVKLTVQFPLDKV